AFQWVQVPPGKRSSRKQSEQSWRQRNGGSLRLALLRCTGGRTWCSQPRMTPAVGGGEGAHLKPHVRACAVTRRRFPMGASPTRQTLQPEASGAVMEATKWLKPQVSTATMHWRPNVVQSATNDASGVGEVVVATLAETANPVDPTGREQICSALDGRRGGKREGQGKLRRNHGQDYSVAWRGTCL